MPYSYDVAVASGATAVFGVPFPYLQKEHVHVSVDGSLIPDNQLVWLSANSLRLPANPANGAKVRRYRTTPAQTAPVTFSPGFVNSADLNIYVTHMLYVVQEAFDAGAEGYQITEQILAYLDSIGATLDQVAALAQATVEANNEVQAAKAVVIQLRNEVQAIVDLAAFGVSLEPAEWITATNVQEGFEQIAAAFTTLSSRVTALEDTLEGMPAELASKYDTAGGPISGTAETLGGLKASGSLGNWSASPWEVPVQLQQGAGIKWTKGAASYSWLAGVSGDTFYVARLGTDALDGTGTPAAALSVSATGAIYTLAYGDLGSHIEGRAYYHAATQATAVGNARASSIAFGGSWAAAPASGWGGRPVGGVVVGWREDGFLLGKYLYFHTPATGWVVAGDI